MGVCTVSMYQHHWRLALHTNACPFHPTPVPFVPFAGPPLRTITVDSSHPTKLRGLNLTFCQSVTDDGVEHLKTLTAMESLNLGFCCRVSADGFCVPKRFAKTANVKSVSHEFQR